MRDPIPIEMLLAGRDLTEPRFDADGAVTFVARWRGSSAILRRSTLADDPERIVTLGPDPAPGRGFGGGCYAGLGGGGVVYAAVDGELWVQRPGAAPSSLTSHERTCRAPVPGEVVTPEIAGPAVVYVVDEAEVWMIDVRGGTPRRLDDGRHEFCFDPAISPDGRTVTWQGWSPPAMPWDGAERVERVGGSITVWRPPDGAVQQPRFAPDGTRAHVHDGSGWLNVTVGDVVFDEPFEHAGPTWGMGQRSFAIADDGDRVAFTRNDRGAGALCVGHRSTGEVAAVAAGVHGQLDWRGDRLVALRSGFGTTIEVVEYSTASWRPRPLAAGPVAEWTAWAVPEPELVEVAHDGVVLHARRYGAGDGRMLCWVHGGPTDQWQLDFRPRIAYWWSRGWDVLVVDPRGSTGHGRTYQQALRGRWGRLDVDDTAALIADAHRRGWARPESTVVVGGSSGGLTVLGVLADHPELVSGGVASYPVSDLLALRDVDHRFEAHYTDTLVGPADDIARYEELSPINRADRITSPLLVFHGTDDPVVPIEQSEALAARIGAGGGRVELVVYDGEGHGFRDPFNQRDEYHRTEDFLLRVVG